jgi:hypothetical protein
MAVTVATALQQELVVRVVTPVQVVRVQSVVSNMEEDLLDTTSVLLRVYIR